MAITLKVLKRDKKTDVSALRLAGRIPAASVPKIHMNAVLIEVPKREITSPVTISSADAT